MITSTRHTKRSKDEEILTKNFITMKHILIFHIVIAIAFLYSCQDKQKKEIVQVVKEWQGKEIVFPEKMIFTQFGQDTVPYSLSESPYKIVMYVDSVGCTSCKLQLHKWKEFITEARFPYPGNRSRIVYLSPEG